MRLVVLAIIFGLNMLVAFNVNAKIWYINDYQNKQLYRSRIHLPQSSQDGVNLNKPTPSSGSCSTYGYLDENQVSSNHECESLYSSPDGICCANWLCKTTIFPYTSCRSGQVPYGECADKDGTKHYQGCKCNTTTYPYTTSNCSYAVSGSSCSDGSGAHYSVCYRNACEKASGESACKTDCTYGCNKSYDGCSSCCVECKTCAPTDCSAYTLTSCPTGAICSSCQRGCGDTTKHYKVTGCSSGYVQSGNTCTYNPCAGYYDCGGPWQYCTGSTCPTDSTKCSVYCVSDYFPYECGSDYGPCYGVSRGSYCSVPCDKEEEEDPCDSVTNRSCSYGCASYYSSCPSKCQTCNSAPEPDPDPEPGVSCTYATHAACKGAIAGSSTCYADSNGCYHLESCQTGYEISGDTCSYCDFNGNGYTLSSCNRYSICDSMTCGGRTRYKITGCVDGMKLSTLFDNECLCDIPTGYWYDIPNHATSYDTWICVNGSVFYYATACESGYSLRGGYCYSN